MLLKIANKTFDLNQPLVMGIINVTPDSFYDGGQLNSINKIIGQASKMIAEGASIIDIGGVSTRPGATELTENEEAERVIPAIKNIKEKLPETIISIDTYRPSVAKKALESGAHIINDISGGTIDTAIYDVAAYYKAPYVLTHIKGTPADMQKNPLYGNVTDEVFLFFEEKIEILRRKGVEQIILDPGFGFGKKLEHNYALLSSIEKFKTLQLPIMAGISRKSMINKVLHTSPAEALNGTSILNTIALLNGANILRVHDVKKAVEAARLVSFYKNIKTNFPTKA